MAFNKNTSNKSINNTVITSSPFPPLMSSYKENFNNHFSADLNKGKQIIWFLFYISLSIFLSVILTSIILPLCPPKIEIISAVSGKEIRHKEIDYKRITLVIDALKQAMLPAGALLSSTVIGIIYLYIRRPSNLETIHYKGNK